jgi:beta-lactamase regulating signal transducer with metallopeptidase domain
MNDLFETAGASVIAFLAQSVIVCALALAAAKIVAGRGPAARIAIYRAGVVSILALILVGPAVRLAVHPWYAVPTQRPATIPQGPMPQAVRDDELTVTHPVPGAHTRSSALQADVPSAGFRPRLPRTDPVPDAPAPVGSVLAIVWLIGVIASLGVIACGAIWVRGLRRDSRPLALTPLGGLYAGLCERQNRAPIRSAISPRVASPFVAGIRRPIIYLPSEIESEFGVADIEAILCHELAHVTQQDCLWALVSKLAVAFAWVNPLAWVVAKQMTLASEELCDRLVLSVGIERTAYANCLLKLAESMMSVPRERLVGAGVAPAKTHLSRRILLLLLDTPSNLGTTVSRKIHALIGGIAALSTLGGCMLVSTKVDPRRPLTPLGQLGFGAEFSAPAVPVSLPSHQAFSPSPAELRAAQTSTLPYLPGDFTLVYKVVMSNIETPAQQRAELRSAREVQAAQTAAKVRSGEMSPERAKFVLAHTVFASSAEHEVYVVTLSCRSGRLLYKEQLLGNDGSEWRALIDRDRIYWTDGATHAAHIDDVYKPGQTEFLPLPAAGFSHFPLSYSSPASRDGAISLSDLPVLGERNGYLHHADGSLLTTMYRWPGTAVIKTVDGHTQLTRLSVLGQGGTWVALDFSFHKFTSFKGVQIASDYTWYQNGSKTVSGVLRSFPDVRCDYSLISASDSALSESAFDPSAFCYGKRLLNDYLVNPETQEMQRASPAMIRARQHGASSRGN